MYSVGTGALKRGAKAANSVADVLSDISSSCVIFNLCCFEHEHDCYFSLLTFKNGKMRHR